MNLQNYYYYFQNALTFRFCDETAYNNLLTLGVTPKKSLTLKINEDLIYNRHFWRWFIDGDGSCQRDKKYRNLRACRNLLAMK
jgi:hypothetical protein